MSDRIMISILIGGGILFFIVMISIFSDQNAKCEAKGGEMHRGQGIVLCLPKGTAINLKN